MKKREKLIIFFILILIIILLIVSYIVLTNSDSGKFSIGSLKADKNEDRYETKNPEIDNLSEKENRDSFVSKIKDFVGLGCKKEQIIYSMINLKENAVCNKNQGDVCTDKTLSCSIEVKNRDNEIGGIFKMELSFVEDGKMKEKSTNSTTSSFFLGPEESQTFSGSINLKSSGQEGIANKAINCFFNTLEVPKKELC